MSDLLEKKLIDLKSEKTRLESEYIHNNAKIKTLNSSYDSKKSSLDATVESIKKCNEELRRLNIVKDGINSELNSIKDSLDELRKNNEKVCKSLIDIDDSIKNVTEQLNSTNIVSIVNNFCSRSSLTLINMLDRTLDAYKDELDYDAIIKGESKTKKQVVNDSVFKYISASSVKRINQLPRKMKLVGARINGNNYIIDKEYTFESKISKLSHTLLWGIVKCDDLSEDYLFDILKSDTSFNGSNKKSYICYFFKQDDGKYLDGNNPAVNINANSIDKLYPSSSNSSVDDIYWNIPQNTNIECILKYMEMYLLRHGKFKSFKSLDDVEFIFS